jgi:thymidylate synthase (FAD)
MWVDYLAKAPPTQLRYDITHCLHHKFPFFFEKEDGYFGSANLIDENPVTNHDKLSGSEMKKHMTLTCKIIGDRSMSHQLVRHRLFAFSQESQRYCNYGKKGYQFIMPPSIADKEIARKEWLDSLEVAIGDYEALLAWKIPPEDARSVLPNCTKTEVVTTGTLGYWNYVFKHRADNPKAQWEIRSIMQGIREEFRNLLPEIF